MFLEVNSGTFLPEWLRNLDHQLFYKLNGQWISSWGDAVIPFLREPLFWIPLYLFLVLFVLINFKKSGLFWILFFIAAVGAADYINSSIIKDFFQRLRPCRDPSLLHEARLLVKSCPSSFSFFSSHAVNHFTIATFIFMTFKDAVSSKWAVIFIWAAMVSYAQVYVGVHSPVDITGGAIVGFIIGYIFSLVFNKVTPLVALSK